MNIQSELLFFFLFLFSVEIISFLHNLMCLVVTDSRLLNRYITIVFELSTSEVL